MKKLLALILSLTFVLTLAGCNKKTQYFFSGKVIEVTKEYLLIEVNDGGNSNLSEGAKVEVSTVVVSADGCPAFVADEYARVVMAKDASENSSGYLEPLAIYKTDETGKSVAD